MSTPQTNFPWASQMVEIKNAKGWSYYVYEPLIRHRWAFYAREKQEAISKLQKLPSTTVSAILEHLYANTPVAKTNLPAFKNCRVVESIPFESTYHRDMMQLLNDEETCDFRIDPRDNSEGKKLHRFILYARSGFFRQQFDQNPNMATFQDPNMCSAAVKMFAGYLYTGRLDPIDPVALVDLFNAGNNYQLRDTQEIDFLALSSLEKLLNANNVTAVRARAQQRELNEVLQLCAKNFPTA